MAHIRKRLRDHLITIVSGLPSTEGRVRNNRAIPKPRAEGIDIVVRTPGEQSKDISLSGTQQRVVRVRMDVTTKGESEQVVADALDQSAVEIEQAIAADIRIGGLANRVEYRGADLTLNGDGERILGVLSLSYDVTVLTKRENPEAVV